jgi:hypothetical protein
MTSEISRGAALSQGGGGPQGEGLSLNAAHRYRIGLDLQQQTTPSAKELLNGVFDAHPFPQAALLIPLAHVAGVPSVVFTVRPEDRARRSASFPYEMQVSGAASGAASLCISHVASITTSRRD